MHVDAEFNLIFVGSIPTVCILLFMFKIVLIMFKLYYVVFIWLCIHAINDNI